MFTSVFTSNTTKLLKSHKYLFNPNTHFLQSTFGINAQINFPNDYLQSTAARMQAISQRYPQNSALQQRVQDSRTQIGSLDTIARKKRVVDERVVSFDL